MSSHRREMPVDADAVYIVEVVQEDGSTIRRGPWPSLSTARAMRTRYIKSGNVEYPLRRKPARKAQILRASNWEAVQ